MNLIISHLHDIPEGKQIVPLKVDRRKLAKRRWRGQAQDGEDFGFDLSHPLSNGTPFHESEEKVYVIEQASEPVLKISFQEQRQAAYYGWMVGNLHFSADFHDNAVIAEDDPAVRQMLERNNIAFSEENLVFEPQIVSSDHHH